LNPNTALIAKKPINRSNDLTCIYYLRERERGTYDIAESDDIEESRRASGRRRRGRRRRRFINVFVGKQSRCLPHRFRKLSQFFDRLHN
jgi:hypothetical protein